MEVGIVIPVYNRAQLVDRTLKSVVAQTHRPIHLVLVDNNSTDQTLAVLKSFKLGHEAPDFRIDVITETTPGAAAARLAGSRLVTCPWIMFFDSDDEMAPDLVEAYAKKIDENGENADIILTRAMRVDLDGSKHEPPYYEHDIPTNNFLHAVLATQRYIVRRSVLELAGNWDPNVMIWNDWELGIRLTLSTNKFAFIRDKVRVTIHCQKESITGTDYASHHDALINTLNIVEQRLKQSPHPTAGKLLKLLAHRRVVLAGTYLHEGHATLGRNLYRDTMNSPVVKADFKLRRILPYIFFHTSHGWRAGAHIIKRFV